MKKFLLFTLAAALVSACTPKEEPSALAEPAKPLARTGKAEITQEELAAKTELLSKEDRQFAQSPIGRRNFLQTLVREKLILLAAADAGLDKSAQHQNALAEKRQELERIYRDFAEDLLIRAWYAQLEESGKVEVTDQEIKDYYKKYPYEMTVKQIILDNAETADQVLRALKNSPSRWKELSRQYNVAPKNMRDDAFSFMPGEFLPEIEVIAANSPTGSVQGFIKTAQGFHIIMKTGEKRLSAKDAQPRIRQILKEQKTDAALNELKNQYEVLIYDKTE